MSCICKAPSLKNLPFPTLFSDAVKICVGKSHRELLLLPTQIRPRWQKSWKNFPDTICRRSENWRWQKSYFRCIFGLRLQKSQRIATYTGTNKTALAKVVENIHWLQQRFPSKECERFANACFPIGDAQVCVRKVPFNKLVFAKIIWAHRFHHFDLFPTLYLFHVIIIFFLNSGGNYNII